MIYDLELINAGKVYDNGTPAVIDFNLAIKKGSSSPFWGRRAAARRRRFA